MTGCPNGCARPYQSDIGIVGRSGDKYTVFVGGHVLGTRLNFMLKDLVPFGEILPTLRPILERFKSQRRGGEGFGDFCHRLGSRPPSRVAAPVNHSFVLASPRLTGILRGNERWAGPGTESASVDDGHASTAVAVLTRRSR